MLNVAVINQQVQGEPRVALAPPGVKKLVASKVRVTVESGAGIESGWPDAAYEQAGAVIGTGNVCADADVLLCVREPSPDRLKSAKPGAVVIGLLSPLGNRDLVDALNDRQLSAMAMELVPRITRAQSMDVLSSQANIAGYKAVVLAASYAPRVFPMMMTAAGTLQPAKAFVIGAGVAGLQAIATARRMGAVVSAYDVRPAVKEQVQSVGARFVELPLDTADAQDAGGYAKAQSAEMLQKQRQLLAKTVAESDIVITTALVPGQPAPKLIPTDAVNAMKPGGVIVDLAAERGGNCEVTVPGEVIQHKGITIVGTLNLAATVPSHASQMYSANVVNLLVTLIDKEGSLKLDVEDEIVKGMLVCHAGLTVHPAVMKSFEQVQGALK